MAALPGCQECTTSEHSRASWTAVKQNLAGLWIAESTTLWCMSQRELKALLADRQGSTHCSALLGSTRSRSRAYLRQTHGIMSEEEEATEVDVRDQVRDLERRLQIAE